MKARTTIGFFIGLIAPLLLQCIYSQEVTEMQIDHERPPWRDFQTVVRIPTSKECPNKCAGCKISKAHGLINDAESYFREYLKEAEPNSEREMRDLVAIKSYVDALRASERAMRDILLRNGTNCPDAERCRGL